MPPGGFLAQKPPSLGMIPVAFSSSLRRRSPERRSRMDIRSCNGQQEVPGTFLFSKNYPRFSAEKVIRKALQKTVDRGKVTVECPLLPERSPFERIKNNTQAN